MTTAVVWSKDACSHCDQAKALLRSHGIDYEERRIGHEWTRDQLLESVPQARSVPQIFLNDTYIGGFADLQRYFNETQK